MFAHKEGKLGGQALAALTSREADREGEGVLAVERHGVLAADA